MGKLPTFQLILLVVFGALFAAGVIIFALASANNNSSSIGQVVIWGTLNETAFNDAVRAVADQDNRLSGVVYVQKDPATYEKDLTEALAAGKGPDLFLMTQAWAYHDAGKVLHITYTELPAAQFQNAFVEAANPFLDNDGVIGIPLLVDPLVLFWNKDVLAAAGHAVPPGYWDEASNDVRDITKLSDSGQITRSGLGFGGYKNINDAKDIITTLIMQAGNSITAAKKNGTLDTVLAPQNGDSTTQTVDAITFYTGFADPSQPTYTWNESLPDARTAFANGDLGLYVGHASEAALITKQNPNLNFAIAALPQIKVGQKYPLTSATVYALGVTNVSKNIAGAKAIAALLSAQALSSSLASKYNMASALRKVVSTPIEGDQGVINKQAIIAKSWIDPDPVQTDQLFQGMIEDVLSGAAKPQESAQRADKGISQLLNP